MRKRTNQIIVRLSDQEMLLLRRKLKANGMTMTGYFRALIVSGEIKTLPPELKMFNVRCEVLVVISIRWRNSPIFLAKFQWEHCIRFPMHKRNWSSRLKG